MLPVNNPAQGVPSHQPTGTHLPGPQQAVQPNTSSVPANPPLLPTTQGKTTSRCQRVLERVLQSGKR